jgi:hypothetical protein
MNLDLSDISKHIEHKELESSYLLHFPIIDSQYIPRNNHYFITFSKVTEKPKPENVEPTKLVSWILGKDPYQYFYQTFEGNQLLYELVIDKDGNFIFNLPKEE